MESETHDVPTDAERSHTLVASSSAASLATISREVPGYPFGSLVAYAVDGQGRPILCLSALAEHSRNLAADGRASLLVVAPDDGSDPLAQPRLTLVGSVSVLSDEARAEALDVYRARHPSALYVGFHDFSVYRLEVAAVRFVGGFGRMSWGSADAYAAAEPDPLIDSAGQIIRHMNDDHADALVAYCRTFAGLDGVDSATMIGVDRYGMDITATPADGTRQAARIAFANPVNSADEVRDATIDLLRTARERLGSR